MPGSDPDSSLPNDGPLPPLDPELLDLERRLGDLVPAAPRPGWIEAVTGKAGHGNAPNREIGVEGAGQRGWVKFAPLGMAAVVMITGGLLASRLDRTSTGERDGKVVAAAPEVAVAETQLVSVSLENTLRETEPEAVVEVEGYGLMRPVMLHFETAQCWIDPETETSVQVIHPWQELVLYPVNTY